MKKTTASLIVIALMVLAVCSFSPNTKAQTGPTVSISPATTQATQLQQTFTFSILISGVQNLWFYSIQVSWDPTVLSLVGTPQTGGFLEKAGSTTFIAVPTVEGGTGNETINDASYSTTGQSGSGILATIEFQLIAQTTSTQVSLSNITLESPPTNLASGIGVPITLASSPTPATINYAAGAPVAEPGPNQVVTEGATVTFNGTGSLPAGSITAYSWSFDYNGKNETLSGATPTFLFSTWGIYNVTLVVTDSSGQSAPAYVTITVNNVYKPVAIIAIEGISQGQSVPAGQTLTLNGSGSSEENGTILQRCLWQVGGVTIGTNLTITYSFTIPAKVKTEVDNVTLTVFDATGQSDTNYTLITVTPGTGQTSTPPPTTSSGTPTPSGASTTSANTTPTPTNQPAYTSAGLPPDVLAITIIITILALGGSIFWLRKRT